MADPQPVLADLASESDDLDALVRDLDDASWRAPTPAAGWTIADQIGHLAWTDEIATLAAEHPEHFAKHLDDMTKELAERGGDVTGDAAGDVAAYADREAARWAALATGDLLDAWRTGREILAAALQDVPPGRRLPWFGPPMSATSMATARLMETWAHGQDVADALGVHRRASDRVRHVAHIGVRTRDFSFVNRGLTPPVDDFHVELVAPSGAVWKWGPDDAAQTVRGPALDFGLLVTQRRHRDDLSLRTIGADADRWLSIAQAFAGPPGQGRAPGARA